MEEDIRLYLFYFKTSTGKDESYPNIDWSKHKDQGDYIIMTDPKVPTTYKD